MDIKWEAPPCNTLDVRAQNLNGKEMLGRVGQGGVVRYIPAQWHCIRWMGQSFDMRYFYLYVSPATHLLGNLGLHA